jgi:antitoxin HicB
MLQMALYKIRLELELNPGPDQVYTVTSPDVPGLVTEGSTPEEILHNVQEALEVLSEAWAEFCKKPPLALSQPAAVQSAELLVAV